MADYLKNNAAVSPNEARTISMAIGSHLVSDRPARGAVDPITNVDFFSGMAGSLTLQQTLDKANQLSKSFATTGASIGLAESKEVKPPRPSMKRQRLASARLSQLPQRREIMKKETIIMSSQYRQRPPQAPSSIATA